MKKVKVVLTSISIMVLVVGVIFFIAGGRYQNGYVILSRAGVTYINVGNARLVAEDFHCTPDYKETSLMTSRWTLKTVRHSLTQKDYAAWQAAMK